MTVSPNEWLYSETNAVLGRIGAANDADEATRVDFAVNAQESFPVASAREAEVIDLQDYREQGIHAIHQERPEAVELVKNMQLMRQLGSLDTEVRGQMKAMTRHPEFLPWLAGHKDAKTIDAAIDTMQRGAAEAKQIVSRLFNEFVYGDALSNASLISWTENREDARQEYAKLVLLTKEQDPTKAGEIRELAQSIKAAYQAAMDATKLPLTTQAHGAVAHVAERAANKVQTKAPKAEAETELPLAPAARIISVHARRNADGTVDMESISESLEAHDATHGSPRVNIDPASIRKLGRDVVIFAGTAAATITGLAAVAPTAEAATNAASLSRPAAIAPRVAGAVAETTKPAAQEQADSLKGVNVAVKSMILQAAKQYNQNPETLAILYAHYAGPLDAAPHMKSNVMGFGAPERAQYEKVIGKNINWDSPADALKAASWLLEEQHPRVPKITGDGAIDAALAYKFGPAAMQRLAAHNSAQMRAAEKAFEIAEANLQHDAQSVLSPGEVHVAANPNAKPNLVPAGQAPAVSAEKTSVDPLPTVNAAYKQIILNAASAHHADPQLMVALFKTYNGTYTKALQHPLNMAEGWMGLSSEAAHGIDRDDFAASAEQAAKMLANTAGRPIGDMNHLEKGTALYEALSYRFGASVINTYIANPHHLKTAILEKINEYKEYDFKTLTQLAAETHATHAPAVHSAPAAPVEKPAAPAPAPKPQLPPSAPAQSKELSAKILSNPNITVDPATPHDRVQKSLTTNEQDGKTFIDDTNHAPSVTLSPQLQQDVLVLANQGFKVKITSVTTGEHVANSDHYKGYAMDIAPGSGSAADYQKMVDFLFVHRDELKIDQLIYGGNLPAGVQLLSNGQPLANAAAFYGQATLNEHKEHIHMSVLDSVGAQPLPPTTVPGQITPPQPPAPAPKPVPAAPSAPTTPPAAIAPGNAPTPESSAPVPSNAPTPVPSPTTPQVAAPPAPAPAPKPEAALKPPAPAVPTALTPEQQSLIDKQPLSAKSKQFEAAILLALEQEKAKGAPINVQIGLDQAMLESGNGTSDIVFGVKGGGPNSVKAPTKEYVNGKEVSTTDSFKVYPTLQAAVQGYVHQIETAPWYKDAASASDNPEQYLKGLQSGGLHYATDPDYTEKIQSRQGYLKLDKVAQATAAPEPVASAPTPKPTHDAPTPAPAPTDNTPTNSAAPAPSVDAAPSAASDSPKPSSSETSDAGSQTPAPSSNDNDTQPSHTAAPSVSPSQAPIAIVQPSASSETTDAPTAAPTTSNHQLPDHIDHGKLDRLLQ